MHAHNNIYHFLRGYIATFIFIITSFFLSITSLNSATAPAAEPDAKTAPSRAAATDFNTAAKTQLTYTDGLILGLVEGITEYLPISSTGHLILTNQLLGLSAPTPLFDKAGQPILTDAIDPTTQQPIPFTLEDAANGYAIIIQAGAIAAVLIVFWQRILIILLGILGKHRQGLILARNIIVAFLPAAFLGLLLDDLIESYLFGPYPVIVALVAGACLMLWVEAKHRPRTPTNAHQTQLRAKDLYDLSIRDCLAIGLLQCVAMWPGTSRSMMTIVGGYLVGLKPKLAAEFSFLLGLVTLTAASGYKTLNMGSNMLKALDWGPVFFGIFVATISAALAVKWLVSYLTKHGLAIFAWYRIALAVLVALVLVVC